MKASKMTPSQLLSHLQTCPDDAPLVFSTPQAEIKGGYHLTEVKQSDVTSVDCGGRVAHWQEASLQLMDGYGGAHMNVGKFRAILSRCLTHLPGLGELPLHAEFAPGNEGLGMFELSVPGAWDDRVVIALHPRNPQCKPLAETMAARAKNVARTAGLRCCGA